MGLMRAAFAAGAARALPQQVEAGSIDSDEFRKKLNLFGCAFKWGPHDLIVERRNELVALFDARKATPASAEELEDTKRLDFIINEECQVEEMMRRGAHALDRVRWPYREESQREWSKSGRDAIDAAILAQQGADDHE